MLSICHTVVCWKNRLNLQGKAYDKSSSCFTEGNVSMYDYKGKEITLMKNNLDAKSLNPPQTVSIFITDFSLLTTRHLNVK